MEATDRGGGQPKKRTGDEFGKGAGRGPRRGRLYCNGFGDIGGGGGGPLPQGLFVMAKKKVLAGAAKLVHRRCPSAAEFQNQCHVAQNGSSIWGQGRLGGDGPAFPVIGGR